MDLTRPYDDIPKLPKVEEPSKTETDGEVADSSKDKTGLPQDGEEKAWSDQTEDTDTEKTDRTKESKTDKVRDVEDKLYSEVPMRPEPTDLLGTINVNGTPTRNGPPKESRTQHRILIGEDTAGLVAYDRNSVENYVAAFKHRIMLKPPDFNPC